VRASRKSSKPFIVFVTTSSKSEASRIADQIVLSHLAACANIIPKVESIFFWKGKVEKAKEFLLIIKTEFRNLKKLEAKIRSLHSYSIPEIIGIPIAWGHKPYLAWVAEASTSSKKKR